MNILIKPSISVSEVGFATQARTADDTCDSEESPAKPCATGFFGAPLQENQVVVDNRQNDNSDKRFTVFLSEEDLCTVTLTSASSTQLLLCRRRRIQARQAQVIWSAFPG